MNRVKAILSGVLTIAMLGTGFGAATLSLAQEADETSGEPPSPECQAFAVLSGSRPGGCSYSLGFCTISGLLSTSHAYQPVRPSLP